MKWFKHISDSLDDPVVFELISKYKGDGYLVFFGILEIYAREFKTDDGWMLDTSLNYLKTKLQVYHAHRLTIIVQSIADLSGWSINLYDDRIKIFIPKFKIYLDEFTLKKLRQGEKKSGHTPDSLPKKVATEVEVEVEVDKPPITPKRENGYFEIFWKAYPKKKSKGQAEKIWGRIKPTKNLVDEIITAISEQKKSKDWLKDGGQFIPHPSTWLNAKGWEDEVNKKESEFSGYK